MQIEIVPVERILPLRHRVLRDGMPPETMHFAGDDAALHWAAVEGGEVVGCVSIMRAPLPEGGRAGDCQLRGMATDERFRRRGIGAALVAAVVAAAGRDRVWCNSRAGAVGLYARAGFTAVGEGFDVPGFGPHLRMAREGGTVPAP